MANDNGEAIDAMLQLSRRFGRTVVGALHEDDVLAASKLEGWMVPVMFLVVAGIVIVLAWAAADFL